MQSEVQAVINLKRQETGTPDPTPVLESWGSCVSLLAAKGRWWHHGPWMQKQQEDNVVSEMEQMPSQVLEGLRGLRNTMWACLRAGNSIQDLVSLTAKLSEEPDSSRLSCGIHFQSVHTHTAERMYDPCPTTNLIFSPAYFVTLA